MSRCVSPSGVATTRAAVRLGFRSSCGSSPTLRDRHAGRGPCRRRDRTVVPARVDVRRPRLDVRVAKVATQASVSSTCSTCGTPGAKIDVPEHVEKLTARRHPAESIGCGAWPARRVAPQCSRRTHSLGRRSAAVGRGVLGYCAHGARFHAKSVRAGAFRGGPQSRLRHPRRGDRGSRSRCAVRGVVEHVGEGVLGTSPPRSRSPRVGNEQGEILLTQRADSGWWLYPVGWADVGYSPSEIAIKEVVEETGIECEIVELIAARRLAARFCAVPMYSLVFYCSMTGGELKGTRSRRAQSASSPARAPAALRGRAPLARPRLRRDRRHTRTDVVRRPANRLWRGD